MRHCLNCGVEVEKDDNFCPECGHWTTKGYSFLKNKNSEKITNGKIVRVQDRISYLFALMFFCMLMAIVMTIYRGQDILKPFVYIKRQVMSYQYGYNTTVLKTDNQYFNIDIPDLESANEKISEDFSEQHWQCKNAFEASNIENNLQEQFDITSVNFCDVSLYESEKISDVILKMYSLFPDMKGYLTNITITNSIDKTEYVAYFQPIYQFVNSTNSLNDYNRVNKTQILLNSYYFANDDILGKPLKENWYIKDATWESLIAHEFGHYITFVTLLKSKGVDNVTLITKDNESEINEIIGIINDQSYSANLVNEAINNYNAIYGTNIDIQTFASLISNYANDKNSKGEYVYDEIIAEAVHDYYLHKLNSSSASLQIISVLNSRL